MPTIGNSKSMHSSDAICLIYEFTFITIFDLIKSTVYTSRGGVDFQMFLFIMKTES